MEAPVQPAEFDLDGLDAQALIPRRHGAAYKVNAIRPLPLSRLAR